MNTAQEPKYIIQGQVVNRQSGHPIPDDEPIFILRGRDRLAIETLEYYRDIAEDECNQEHIDAIDHRIDQFKQFELKHPDRIKIPDTQLTNSWEKRLPLILFLFCLLTFAANAQTSHLTAQDLTPVERTNTVDTTWITELTLHGEGITTRHGTEFALDVTYETNPFKWAPSLWLAVDQAVGWQPDFAGSTDFTAEYAFPIYKDKVYLNVGWSGGCLYGSDPLTWRTGPEFNFQWFTYDHVFVYAGLNFDAFRTRGALEVRPGIGIGMTW